MSSSRVRFVASALVLLTTTSRWTTVKVGVVVAATFQNQSFLSSSSSSLPPRTIRPLSIRGGDATRTTTSDEEVVASTGEEKAVDFDVSAVEETTDPAPDATNDVDHELGGVPVVETNEDAAPESATTTAAAPENEPASDETPAIATDDAAAPPTLAAAADVVRARVSSAASRVASVSRELVARWRDARASSSVAPPRRFLVERPDLVLRVGTWMTLCSAELPLSNAAVMLLALLGSSVGFFSFLYFISVGYGLGVALPAAAVLWSHHALAPTPPSAATNLHAALVVAWGLRLSTFLLRREFVDWRAWHDKVVEVDARAKLASRLSVWTSCAALYAAVVAPCLCRARDPDAPWGAVGRTGLAAQIAGLTIETVADEQKARFKNAEGNRHRPCVDAGLWRHFTHPNYLGDGLFWIGTYLAGVGAATTAPRFLACTSGLLATIVVLRGATEQLNEKQSRNYGRDEAYVAHRRRVGFLGPRSLWRGGVGETASTTTTASSVDAKRKR